MGDNTSPILLTDVPQPIATFNKSFELSELVGNLDGVMYMSHDEVSTAVSLVSYEESGVTRYALAYNKGDNDEYVAYLTVEGNSLMASYDSQGNYLFDLDFKHQNRKFFEKQNGTYAVALPWLGLDAESKVLVSVSGESYEEKSVTIHYVDNDYRAWGYAGEAIREISWFNQLLTSANIANIVTLVEKLINLEYSPEAAGGITVTSANTQPSTVTGNWNLFTDGAAFIPLRIVSRFPNGSPVMVDENQNIICEFNREPNVKELVGKISAVISALDGTTFEESSDVYGDIQIQLLGGVGSPLLVLGIDGVYLKGNEDEDFGLVYDIDFDHQFRRSAPAGLVKMNVQIPQLLDNPSAGQGFGIIHESEVPENFGVFAAQDNAPYIVEGNTLSNEEGGWANSLTWANVQSLLGAIIAMEFEGFDDNPPSVQGTQYRESLATGFTVTPLIPQTLS